MTYLTVPLNNLHNKREFGCGKKPLDDYLQMQAKQDVKRKLSACFVLAGTDNHIKGFYTLSSAAIPRQILPEEIIKKMPPAYHNLPATLLGRLAVDEKYKRQGLGELLLMDALKRSYDVSVNSIGSMSVIVDPLDDDAVNFYKRYGFIYLPTSGKMFLPMDTVAALFSNK